MKLSIVFDDGSTSEPLELGLELKTWQGDKIGRLIPSTTSAREIELERIVDGARVDLEEILGLEDPETLTPSLERLVELVGEELKRRLDVEGWPTIVNVIRKLREREHPRDRRPGDPAPYHVVFDPDDWESEPRAALSYSHRDGVRTFTLEELPFAPEPAKRRVVDRPQS